MVQVSEQGLGGVMDRNAVAQSLSNMSFGPPSSGSDEHSFIVLERETAEDMENGLALAASMRSVDLATNGFEPNGVTSNHFGENPSLQTTPRVSLRNVEMNSYMSNGPLSLPANVQQRMDSLIQENQNLQVTVDQTNSDLRQMMMTLAQWRGDMEKLREDHKEKFQETRNLVLKLKKEKAEMRAVIEELQGKVDELQNKPMPSLIEAIVPTVNEMELKSTIEDLQSQLNVAKAARDVEVEEKAEMRAVIEELQEKVDELQNKPMPSLFEAVVPTVNEMELKSTIEDLQSQLNVAMAARDAEVEKNGTYVEEISSLKRDMIGLKNRLKELKAIQGEVENNKASFESLHKADVDELITLREENLRLKNDVVNLSSVERHSQDYQVAQAKGFIHRIDELTAKLMCTEEELQKAQSEIAQLKDKPQSSIANEEALSKATASVERLRLRVDEMTAIIVELQEKCETQAREITSLKESNAKQNEAVGILQAQVEVYRVDFIAERDCRERLAGEKEQLAEDLRRLHRHNLELQNGHRPSQRLPHANTPLALRNEERNRNEGHAVEAAEETEQPTSIYRCPICNTMTFRTLQSVNDHIDRCLGIDIP